MLASRKTFVVIGLLLLMLAGTAASQTRPVKNIAMQRSAADESFPAAMQKLRDTWVQEFNAGHADRVAALYAEDAVMMRWDGSVHTRDSILAELERSVRAGVHGYTVSSLHAERSGDLGYDTGAYNVTLRDREVEGNYVIVVKNIGGRWMIVAHASVPNPATP